MLKNDDGSCEVTSSIIYLHASASIQPRTSPPKFGRPAVACLPRTPLAPACRMSNHDGACFPSVSRRRCAPVENAPGEPARDRDLLRRGDELGPPGDLLRAGALLTGDTMPPPHPAFNTLFLPQLFEIRIADLIPKFYHAPQSNKPSRLLLSPRRTDTLIYHKNSLHPSI